MAEKLKLWRQRLLDTGKRNKLLNFRETKRSTLKIIYPEIDILYSDILSGDVLKFPVNDDKQQGSFLENGLVKEKKKGSILSSKSGNELDKSLYHLRLRSRTALEELGINILYIAFGFLEWTETDYSNEKLKSPLLLVPVELKKESILSSYTLSLFDEDIVINPTLFFKLENDFGVKIEYEVDSDDFNLQNLFDYVSNKVSVLNWSVSKDVQLSPFSFLKLNMYKDLEKNESRIMENVIIKALCGEPSQIEGVPEDIASANELDKIIIPKETFQVVDADSSQQQAILAAKRGISFVLQGPPGTGKSQTITNIIAECLALGKKVLFVSEKMAALEVVYRNLQQVNLEDFCLQLHSHKANKALVIKELSETLNKPKTHSNGDITNDLELLGVEKEILNNYVSALHKLRQPLGKTVFQIHGEFEKQSQYPDVQFRFENINEKTTKNVNDFVYALNSYMSSIMKIGEDYRANCFYGFSKSVVTFELQNDIHFHFSKIISLLNEILKRYNKARIDFSLKEYKSIEELPGIIALLELISSTPNCPSGWLVKGGISDIQSQLEYIYSFYKNISEKEKIILQTFDKEILKFDANEILQRFDSKYGTILRFMKSDYRKDIKVIKGFLKNRKLKVKYPIIANQLKTIKQIQELTTTAHNEEIPLRNWLGDLYDGRKTNWKFISSSLIWICKINDLYGTENVTVDFAEKVCHKNASNLAESDNSLLLEEQQELTKELTYFNELYDTTQYNIASEQIQNVIKKLSKSIENINYLPDWVDFIQARNICFDLKLQSFLDEVEIKGIPAKQYIGTLLKRFYMYWLDDIYQQENELAGFQREKFEYLITDFQKKDVNQFNLAKVRIRQILSTQRPDSTGFTSRGTEIHTLMREAEKRRKILPLRKLFEKIPNLLLTLKPCLLMSPLSVSQFINPELYEFDTVIFDEASQVCTENAIGAIYRGRQLIVVGDREQLPPSNFFSASISDGDYDEDNEDGDEEENSIGAYESILDECGSILNRLQLLWHYRSRHENLIAFSNVKIYKNLITFPTPTDGTNDMGVEFIHVPTGVYERSTTRFNKIEAQRVAQIVFNHFEKYPLRSLGIVTFSEAQQAAIDNEISIIRKAKPQFEPFFDTSKKEPFFIKNLENVQGDERDTIIFSIGYGRDQNGRLTMFFGPLNHEGGYRRLNVAITRAKLNVKLVSSILPTDIDLSRSNSLGIHMLRAYMDFAIRGMEAIKGELSIPESIQFDSPFEMQVYDVLKNTGFEVDTQVGCSGYRIDLAVRHPSLKGRYVIAIECDGATYHSARTARERDRLREDLLKIRGWKIYRIWSTDWIRHRAKEVERLVLAVNKAISEFTSEDNGAEVHKSEKSIGQLEHVINGTVIKSPLKFYSATNIQLVPRNNPKGDFYYVADVITFIVHNESPIHKEVIYHYLAPLFGNERVTKVIISAVERILQNYCEGRFIVKGDFLWSISMKTPIFRVPGVLPPRDIKHIAPEEIAEGMKIIIIRAIGIEKITLFQLVSKELGFERTGEKINSLLDVAFNQLITSREIEVKGNIVAMK